MASLGGALLRPLLLALVGLCLLLAALGLSGEHANRDARERDGRLLLHAIQQHGLETARLIEPFAVSDDAAEYIHTAFTPRWARRELVRIAVLAQQDVVLIVQPDGFVAMALQGREDMSSAQLAMLMPHLAPALAAMRGQRNAHRPQGTAQGQGLRLTLAARIDGRPALVNLVTVIPLSEVQGLPPPPLLVTWRHLDSPAFLRGLGAATLLGPLRVVPLHEAGPGTVTLADAQGAPVLRLGWEPARPGDDVMSEAMLFAGAGAGLLGLMALFFAFRTRRALRDLAEARHEAVLAARTDPLTGLPNRRALEEETRPWDAPLTLMLLDVDRFGRVNAGVGHARGDRVLAATARRLADWLRDTAEEGRLYRLEGDRFVLVMPIRGEDCVPATRLFARMRRVVRQAVPLEGGAVLLDLTGGIALAPQHGDTAEALLRHADSALRAAKRGGRGRALVFEPGHDAWQERRLSLEAALLRALREDALHVHYQPQFDVRTGAVQGVEALARWDDPRLGRVPPGEFIPLAEEMGVISDVALLILRHSLPLLADPRMPVISINLSAAQFRRDGFQADALEVLRAAGVAPGRVEFEVTESVLVEDTQGVQRRFNALRASGFGLALDDFGTGFSALAYLRYFRFDRLKVDRGFLIGLGEDPQARALMASIIHLGHGLGLDVVAEGVETAAQLAVLRDLGCDTAQGYFLASPMPAEQLRALLGHAPLFDIPAAGDNGSAVGA